MDLNKLHKRKQKAEDENNQQLLAETCHKLGTALMAQSKFEAALKEFNQESRLRKLDNSKLDFARAQRMIGEALMGLGRYQEAQKHEQVYLKIAKESDDLVEQQRAYATIGRCYLLQAEDESSVAGSDRPESDYKSAEKAFLKSLIICKELTKLVNKWELADMQARLYLNLGVTKEHSEEAEEAISYYEKAIKICNSNDLHELQHQCLMAAGLSFASQRCGDNVRALSTFNRAIEVAKRLPDKSDKSCETLLAIGNVLIKTSDFQGAKQALKRAYKLRTSVVADREAIEKLLRTVITICKCEDELVTTSTFDYVRRGELFEQLGDATCKLKHFPKAIDYYLKSLEAAELNGASGEKLIPIYVSLYQTYIDNKDYLRALEYMRKEYEHVKDDAREAATTLLSISNILDLSGADFWDVEGSYKRALAEARKCDDEEDSDSVLESSILRKYIAFCRQRSMTTIADMLEREASERGLDVNAIAAVESSEDFECSEDLLGGADNNIQLDLILSSDAESSSDEKKAPESTEKSSSRKSVRQRKQTVKVNAKGETKLHEAAISGNYHLAKLLLDQGHGVNVRDNAGWLPLHEAANHGNRDVVELLLDHGASINDKGGVSCDGITPIHDAACNGHLSTVLLLLERGAKATMKTNYDETTLDLLQRWHRDHQGSMTPAERELYDEIKLKLTEQCERVGIEIKSINPRQSLSHDKPTSQLNHSHSRYSAMLSDDEDADDDVDSGKDEAKAKGKENNQDGKNAREEYRTVMKKLKNPQRQTTSSSLSFGGAAEAFEAKRKAALLNENDVSIDNWLDDDLGPTKKRTKLSESSAIPGYQQPAKRASSALARRPSNSSLKSIESGSEATSIVVPSSDDEENGANIDGINAFDVVMNPAAAAAKRGFAAKSNRRLEKKKSDTRSSWSSPTAATSQPSLLEQGFSRFVDSPSKELTSSPRKSTAPPPPPPVPTESVDKQIIIRVQVDDERVIVPMNREIVESCKISWLADEAAARYYRLKGIRPELVLKTGDGATLLPTDSLALIFSISTDENIIHSEIRDWKLPSLEKRYIEACSEYKCAVDSQLIELLTANRNSSVLSLSNQNLNSSLVRPIMKAIQHQSALTELSLANNSIQDDGVKFLAPALATLKVLNFLDISGNMVTETGIEFLTHTLAKSQLPCEIKHLNLSFNPLRSTSLKFISDLCRLKNISQLEMASCDLSSAEHATQLSSLRHLNISYNHFSSEALRSLLKKLNSSIVESLNLEKCSQETELGGIIVEFIQAGSFVNLVDINLRGLELDENEILDILRCLEKCENLKSINLSNQSQITFLSLKYLLFSAESRSLEKVVLLNCRQLRTASNLASLQLSFTAENQRICNNLRHIQLSLPRELPARREFVDTFKRLWESLCGGRERFEENKSTLSLLRDDDERIFLC